MKPHPRIRKTAKWGGAAVTVLLVVVWIGSGFHCVDWVSNGMWWIGLRHGRIGVGDAPVGAWNGSIGRMKAIQMRPGFYSYTDRTSFLDWTLAGSGDPGFFSIRAPLWPVAMLTGLATALAWRLDTLARRRARLNLCPTCHYDRTGLAAGAVCPECGSASG